MSPLSALQQQQVRGAVAPQGCKRSRTNVRAANLTVPAPTMMDRRALVSSCILLASFIPVQNAQSSAPSRTLCVEQDTAEAADDCRRRVLQADAGKEEDYGRASSRNNFTVASGVPVADMGDTYTKETVALYDAIIQYASMDPFDKARPQAIKILKLDAANWVSQYARGGSARKQSARRMYVAADAVSGHLASNGYAPFPAYKFKNVKATMEEALVFLSEGK